MLQSSTTEFTDEKHVNRGRGSLLYKTKPCPPFASVSSVLALFLSVVALFSLFVAVGSAQAPSAADWTQFQGNAPSDVSGIAVDLNDVRVFRNEIRVEEIRSEHDQNVTVFQSML